MRATFSKKKARSGCLAKPDNWPSRCCRISMTFSTRAARRSSKNSSALFPAKPIVQRRIFINSKILEGLGGGAESKFLRLKAKRILDGRVAFGSEKRTAVKSGEVVQLEETIFGCPLRFQLAAAADMRRRNAALEKSGTNHQETVAL